MLPISVEIKTAFQLLILTLFSSQNNFCPGVFHWSVTNVLSSTVQVHSNEVQTVRALTYFCETGVCLDSYWSDFLNVVSLTESQLQCLKC